MTTHADLVRMAEAATPGPKADPRGFLTSDAAVAEYEAAYERHIAAWHPARALAALAVIEAADGFSEAWEGIGWDDRTRSIIGNLRAALAAWNALNDPEGSE